MRLANAGALRPEQYEELSNTLYEYDVIQGGWEHEAKGIGFNANHVLKELVRARRKDMFDPSALKSELAPDATQYALRLQRWAILPTEFILPTVEDDEEVEVHQIQNEITRKSIAGWALAEITLANHTHRLDHPFERISELPETATHLSQVSRYLLYFAEFSAAEFDFDLQQSFVERIDSLRKRFSIPKSE